MTLSISFLLRWLANHVSNYRVVGYAQLTGLWVYYENEDDAVVQVRYGEFSKYCTLFFQAVLNLSILTGIIEKGDPRRIGVRRSSVRAA